MAFFLSQELTLTSDAAVKDKDQAQCATRAEWSSYAEPMLLAVALENTQDGGVSVYLEDGSLFENEGVSSPVTLSIQRQEKPIRCECLSWHPNEPILAVGWEDGSIAIWSYTERWTKDNKKCHSSRIEAMRWSQVGKRLITGDSTGKVIVWKVNQRGVVAQIVQYDNPDSSKISNICFNPSPKLQNLNNDSQLPMSCPPFHYAVSERSKQSKNDLRGVVFLADDNGHRTKVLETESEVLQLLVYKERDGVVVLSKNLVLSICVLSGNTWTTATETKLSTSELGTQDTKSGNTMACWLGPHTIAVGSDHDEDLRCFNLQTEASVLVSIKKALKQLDTAVPSKSTSSPTPSGMSGVCAMAYVPSCRLLFVCTRNNSVLALWSRPQDTDEEEESEDDSQQSSLALIPKCKVQLDPSEAIGDIVFDNTKGRQIALVSRNRRMILLRYSRVLNTVYKNHAMILREPDRAFVADLTEGSCNSVQAGQQIVGADIFEDTLAVWGLREAHIFQNDSKQNWIRSKVIKLEKSPVIALYSGLVLQSSGRSIAVTGLLDGAHRSTTFSSTDTLDVGRIVGLRCVSNGTFGALSHRGFIRLWQLSGQEIRPYGNMNNCRRIDCSPFADDPDQFTAESISMNCEGTRLSILLSDVQGMSSLVVYDAEADKFFSIPSLDSSTIIQHNWDTNEPKLLACELLSKGKPSSNAGLNGIAISGSCKVATFFATADKGVIPHDTVVIEKTGAGKFVGIDVPYYHFIEDGTVKSKSKKKGKVNGSTDCAMGRQLMPNFTGDEALNDSMKSSLIAFSFNLAVGDMDKAYQEMRLIRDVRIWHTMASICVRTRNLDILGHCLAHMGHTRGARALREALAQGMDTETAIGLVAVQLSMNKEAVKIFEEAKRFDLLGAFWQASGKWDKALEIAESKDRINLRTTHYRFAQSLEADDRIAQAIREYELAGRHCTEVPRMLWERGEMDELVHYIAERDEPDLHQWLARYYEANGEVDRAIEEYNAAGDTLSLVKLYSSQGNHDEAFKIAVGSGNKAAIFHVARNREIQILNALDKLAGNSPHEPFDNNRLNPIKESIDAIPLEKQASLTIDLYEKAGVFAYGTNLAMKVGMDSEVMRLAVQSPIETMIDAAVYFEEKGDLERAAILYQKGNNLSRALDMCFKEQLYEALEKISSSLDQDTEKTLVIRCASYFTDNGQNDKAVKLLIAGNQKAHALDLVEKQGLKVDEELVEQLNPLKSSPGASPQSLQDDQVEMLMRLAKVCERQGLHHLACKSYVQAGDKVKAMESLVKCGDTDKIVQFASVSRQRKLYVIAANYLQTLDWRNSPDVMKAIVQFYKKAKAVNSLASFYDACAQLEIDEFGDYDKAGRAMQESIALLESSAQTERDSKLGLFRQRLAAIQTFIEARQVVHEDPDKALKLCASLIDAELAKREVIESAVRIGDVLALELEYYYTSSQFDKAYLILESMRARSLVPTRYADSSIIESIQRQVKQDHEQSPLGEDNLEKDLEDSDGSVDEEIPDGEEASH